MAVSQGLLLSVAFLTMRRGSRAANRTFAALMIVATGILCYEIYGDFGLFYQFPHFIRITSPLNYAIGPLLYFYVRALMDARFQLSRWHLLHFAPVLLRFLYSADFYFASAEAKILWFENFVQNMPLESYILGSLWRLQRGVYILFSLRLLWQYSDRKREPLPRKSKQSHGWLTILLILFAISWTASLSRYFRLINIDIGGLAVWLDSMIMYIIGYLGLLQPDVFSGSTKTEPPLKYQKSPLSEEQSKAYLNKLLEVMEHDKPFKDSEITLQTLAKKVRLPPYQLSQIINEQLQQNFFDFTNRYRVEEVKRRLISNDGHLLTLEEIAYQAGFNSTSAFNAAFKKQTEMTPSQFRKEVQPAIGKTTE